MTIGARVSTPYGSGLNRTNVRFHLALSTHFSYDSLAGSSSESASIATVARASATTRSTGDVASIEVVAR